MRGQRPGQRRCQERDLQPDAQPDREHQPADQRPADTHRGGASHQRGARAAAAPPPAAASTAAASGSSSSLLWLWIALAAVVLIGLVVWIARASGRRSATASGRRSAMIDTYAKGQALADAIRVADRPGVPGADAGGRWAGLQARADDLSRELYRLRESASDEGERMRVGDTLDSLRGLRSAMADEQAAGGAGGPGSPEAAQVHGRLMAFEESLRALRAPYEQMPRI